MDRKYIESQHIVEHYLAGELSMREARDFESYCREDPELLRSLPFPVRLKARLSRRPIDSSETGMFKTIPSSVTHAVLARSAADMDDGDDDDEPPGWRRAASLHRIAAGGLLLLLLAALAGWFTYGMQARELSRQLQTLHQQTRAMGAQPPGSVQTYRVQPEATLAIGSPSPPQLLDLFIDVSEGGYTQFQVTIDSVDAGRLMQIRRIARDSNRELRLGLNSSAFGPGEYLVKIDGYTWRGQTRALGSVRLQLR